MKITSTTTFSTFQLEGDFVRIICIPSMFADPPELVANFYTEPTDWYLHILIIRIVVVRHNLDVRGQDLVLIIVPFVVNR